MSDPSGLDLLGRLLPTLVLLAVAALGARWWTRRARGPVDHSIEVLARAGLARGALIAVVQVAGRRLLVGATDRGVTLLSELPDDASPSLTEQAMTGGATAEGHLRSQPLHERPWKGLVNRLREQTVRTHSRRPARGLVR